MINIDEILKMAGIKNTVKEKTTLELSKIEEELEKNNPRLLDTFYDVRKNIKSYSIGN